MIIVDTSVWIDHLHSAEPQLIDLLDRAEVVAHPLVIEELAMGSIKDRDGLIAAMEAIKGGRVLSHEELMSFVEARSLWGRGLSPVDAQLLGAAVLANGGMTIWTRDKPLAAAARSLGVAY